MDDSLPAAASSASSARKLLSHNFNAAPVDAAAPKPLPPPAPVQAALDFITADQLLAYTLSPHKPLLLLPWSPDCILCNATALIAQQANKLLGDSALAVRAARWDDDAIWEHWLRNSSLLYLISSSFRLPEPPTVFVMNGVMWYSTGPGSPATTEAPPPAVYAQPLNMSMPASCLRALDLATDDTDAAALLDRHCVIDMAASMARAVHVPLPVLCQSSSCTLLQRCSVMPTSSAAVESRCVVDDVQLQISSTRLQSKLSFEGSYAFALDDFFGGNYERVKILFDDGGSSAASDLFRLFAMLLQEEAPALDFAITGDPELISRFNAQPSSLIAASFPYMDTPHVITSAAWSLQQFYTLFQ